MCSSNKLEQSVLEQEKLGLIVRLIQGPVRGWLSREKFRRSVLLLFDEIIPETCQQITLKPVLDVYKVFSKFIFVWKKHRDRDRFSRLCQYLIISLESDSPKMSYIGVPLNKDFTLKWISHINKILWNCCEYLEDLKPEVASDVKVIMLCLHILVSFTSTNTWTVLRNKNFEILIPGMNQLCATLLGHLFQKGMYVIFKKVLLRGLGRAKVTLKQISLSAIITLTIRPLIAASFSSNLLTMFIIHILSVPALIKRLHEMAPDSISLLESHQLFHRTLSHLSNQQSMRIVFNSLEGNYALCLLANIINLAFIGGVNEFDESCLSVFPAVVTKLLESCQNYVGNKQSNLAYWHPVLGWFTQPMDSAMQHSMPFTIKQLQLLWSQDMIQLILGNHLHNYATNLKLELNNGKHTNGNFIKKILDLHIKSDVQKTNKLVKIEEIEWIMSVCSLYQATLNTFPQLHLSILTGLCYQNHMLCNLWLLLSSFESHCGMKTFHDNFLMEKNTRELQMLHLFSNCMVHYITLLDDMEMYEQQNLFKLSDYVTLSGFLNEFLYKSIVANSSDQQSINKNPIFSSLHTLLLLLYQRDCRRRYTPSGHWLIKEIKVSNFMSDLDKGRLSSQALLQNMPHIIPHGDRVRLFRKYILNEKGLLGLTESACATPQSTLITIRRCHIIEDGYQQLGPLSPQTLKGIIRVKFINEQGLEEAGIDQDGVFREFLEESLKLVFRPSLNLFTVTSEEKLYPSPASYLQKNHLSLFEFIGRMLGKAVYEGIVVDAPFASFFLTQLSGQKTQALHSSIDELPSLDPGLYKNLSYVKHYEGDVADLDLTFSVNDETMGKISTHELIPGGKVIPVTNENKIYYIHKMAHFRMHIQIKEQVAAFVKGFQAIINFEWLNLFSAPELQKLISGDNVPLNMNDLRKHTQYYGGFHDSHKVIRWLWDVLENEFSEDEKALFLKFVTSCSKPPLLGFAHLDPPFSIRCVEVGDDEDSGDTVGSVLRGFFTIRKKDPLDRLPTSSTCFNLLKLPNYNRKTTLREKLRYAIMSNTGFELS